MSVIRIHSWTIRDFNHTHVAADLADNGNEFFGRIDIDRHTNISFLGEDG